MTPVDYYNPAIGRFTSEDPIGVSGGLNFYDFGGNNPVRFRDPFGLEKEKCDEDPCAYLLPKDYPIGLNSDIFLKNMKEAQKNDALWWINQVKQKGNWDYKYYFGWRNGGSDIGNFNYGTTGRAAGWDWQILKRAAGLLHWRWDSDGHFWGGYLYGDAHDDMDQIIWGMAYYECMRKNGKI
jgi:uncharacterized protein RhaS with RHS repeats